MSSLYIVKDKNENIHLASTEGIIELNNDTLCEINEVIYQKIEDFDMNTIDHVTCENCKEKIQTIFNYGEGIKNDIISWYASRRNPLVTDKFTNTLFNKIVKEHHIQNDVLNRKINKRDEVYYNGILLDSLYTYFEYENFIED